jgi:hypothetical protein
MITIKNINNFKELYNSALNDNLESFIFEGQEVLTSYAKYVIEYFNIIIKNT